MNSTIQGASRRTEKIRRKTNRDKRSQRAGDRENIEYKKNKRSGEVFSAMEGVYGGAQYLGKERRLRKCRGSTRGI